MKYNFDKYINVIYKHKGRDFSGVDCYGLVYLIFKEEKGIILPDLSEIKYSYNLKDDDPDFIPMLVDKHGKKIMIEIKRFYKPFDILILYGGIGNYNIANHMGIFLNDISFLHITNNTRSLVSKLDTYYSSKIYKVLRYVGDTGAS